MSETRKKELTDFLKSIPEDPMPEEMWDEEPAVTIVYDAWGNVLEVKESETDDGSH